MNLKKKMLREIDALVRRLHVFPIFCDDAAEETDLSRLALALLEEPIDASSVEALVEKYMERNEFQAARRLLAEPALAGSIGLPDTADKQRLDSELTNQLFLAQSRADRLLVDVQQLFSECNSAFVIAETEMSVLKDAERWFQTRPLRMGPLIAFLEHIRERLQTRLDEQRATMRNELSQAASASMATLARKDHQQLIQAKESELERLLVRGEWSLFRDGLDQLRGVKGDTTATKLAGARRDGDSWKRACPYRSDRTVTPKSILDATESDEANRFIQSWFDFRKKKEKVPSHLSVQLFRWLGVDYNRGKETFRSEDGIVHEFSLRQTTSWVSERFGGSGAVFYLIIPSTRNLLNPATLRSDLKSALGVLVAKAPQDGIKIFLYPETATPEFRAALPERTAVLDDADLHRLAPQTKDERTRAFLEILLPQLRVELATPYHVLHGATPESMFVGREQEITLLVDRRNAPTIIFSGRCLGKTSLLQQVRRRVHDPNQKRFAFFRSISVVGVQDTGGLPNAPLLNLIAEDIRAAHFDVAPFENGDLNGFLAAMRGMLSRHTEHEFVFLLDEADAFAEAERLVQGKGVSWGLRDLQFEYNDRIRFTFAGYQHLHRAYNERSLAFANWRGLKRLSVLTPEEARHLVRRPVEELGFEFEQPTLIDRIVHYTGRHPRLVQVFCNNLGKKVRERSRREPFVVRSGDVEEVFNDEGTSGFIESLRHTFNMNLQEDGRLQFIVYWLIEQAMRGAVALQRFSLQEIHAALESVVQDQSPYDETSTRLLLDELHALGIVEPDGATYRLGNRQHARILFQAADFRAVRESASRRIREQPRKRKIYCIADDERDVVAQGGEHVFVLGLAEAGEDSLLNALFPISMSGMSRAFVRLNAEGLASIEAVGAALKKSESLHGIKDPNSLVTVLLRSQEQSKTQRTLVLERVDQLVAAAGNDLRQILEQLHAEPARFDDGELRVRLVLTGGPSLARAFHNEWFLFATAATLRRLEEKDLESWCRTRQVMAEADVRRRLHAIVGGRASILEDFRRWLAAKQRGEELMPTRAHVDEFADQLQQGARTSELRKVLFAGLSANEIETLRRAVGSSDDWGSEEISGEIFDEICKQSDAEQTREIIEMLVAVDLLGAPPSRQPGFVVRNDDPVRVLMR